MNKAQAAAALLISDDLLEAMGAIHIIDNREVIQAYVDGLDIEIQTCGGWVLLVAEPDFHLEPHYYRIQPTKKINWEKAMKNGAWGTKCLFWDHDAPRDAVEDTLTGYRPSGLYSFIGEDDIYTNCEVIGPIPEEWLS